MKNISGILPETAQHINVKSKIDNKNKTNIKKMTFFQ
jgi:hypothetical protein